MNRTEPSVRDKAGGRSDHTEEQLVAQLHAVADRHRTGQDLGALVQSARAGDEAALARLHAEHNPQLVRYLRAIAGPDVERIAARAWIGLARRLGELPNSGVGFRTLLLERARHELDRERRGPHAWDDDPVGRRLLGHAVLTTDDPAEFAAATMAGDAAASRIVDALPHEQADLTLLSVVMGCTAAEVADVVGSTPVAVQQVQAEAGLALEQAFGAAGLHRLLERASQTPELTPPDDLVAAMSTAARRYAKHGFRLTRMVTVKGAVVAALVLGTATGAAAATGSLPDVAQTRIAAIASHVGVELPSAGDTSVGDESDLPPTDQPADIDGPGSGVSDDTRGAVVSGVATETELEGSEKGHQIADTAKEQGGPPEGVVSGPPEDRPAAPQDGSAESKPRPPPAAARHGRH